MSAESPAPHLPRGAGGSFSRAAGRGSPPAALVLEPDPLARLLIGPAVEALGFSVVPEGPVAPDVAAVFVPLGRGTDCRDLRCTLTRRSDSSDAGWSAREEPPGALVVGYGRDTDWLLAAHRAHGCCDLVLRLVAASGEPRLQQVPAAGPVGAAGLSTREADVLVLLLRGFTTPAIAARLCVAECTARSHCRAVLRKLGAPDRRALRALLDGPASQDCRGFHASFAEEWAVADYRPALHT